MTTLPLDNSHHIREHLRERASATVKRRQFVSRLMIALCWVAIALAALPLGDVIINLFIHGWASVSSWAFYSQLPAQPTLFSPDAVGGVSNAIVGSGVILGYALLGALPIGIGIGVYNAESDSRFAIVLRLVVATMVGAPSILMGLFAFGLVVVQFGFGFCILAGAFAIGTMMLPVLAASTEIAVRNVPATLREAGLALGAKKSTTSLRIVLPAAITGIVSGAILAISRAIGETAPVLRVIGGSQAFTWKAGDFGQALPLMIYQDASSSYPAQRAQAWGIALFIVIVVFVLSLTARIWANSKQRERR